MKVDPAQYLSDTDIFDMGILPVPMVRSLCASHTYGIKKLTDIRLSCVNACLQAMSITSSS